MTGGERSGLDGVEEGVIKVITAKKTTRNETYYQVCTYDWHDLIWQ